MLRLFFFQAVDGILVSVASRGLGDVYKGHGGTFNGPNDFIQNCLGKIPTLWSDFEIEPIQMYESGNTVFMHGKITAGGKTSETMHMSVVEDGKFVKFQAFDDSATLNSVANT